MARRCTTSRPSSTTSTCRSRMSSGRRSISRTRPCRCCCSRRWGPSCRSSPTSRSSPRRGRRRSSASASSASTARTRSSRSCSRRPRRSSRRSGWRCRTTLNPVMVAFYETIGFLPEAVLNALSRLGWSLDDKTEIMSLDFVVEHFTLDRVVKGPAGFDPDKLLAYQEHWMGQLPLDEKVERCLPYLVRAKWISEPVEAATREFVARLISALGDRLKLFGDIVHYEEFFVADEALQYDEKAFEKRLRKPPEAAGLLRGFRDVLAASAAFDTAALEKLLHEWVAAQGVEIRADHPRATRRRHRESRRAGDVRLPGAARPRAVRDADRPGAGTVSGHCGRRAPVTRSLGSAPPSWMRNRAGLSSIRRRPPLARRRPAPASGSGRWAATAVRCPTTSSRRSFQ